MTECTFSGRETSYKFGPNFLAVMSKGSTALFHALPTSLHACSLALSPEDQLKSLDTDPLFMRITYVCCSTGRGSETCSISCEKSVMYSVWFKKLHGLAGGHMTGKYLERNLFAQPTSFLFQLISSGLLNAFLFTNCTRPRDFPDYYCTVLDFGYLSFEYTHIADPGGA